MEITYRKATEKDLDLYFKWANEESTRYNSFNSEPIDYQVHIDWFLKKIIDSKTLMLVFENEKKQPLGQVRIEQKETENIIGISVEKEFRGKGLGVKFLEISCKVCFLDFHKKIRAYIKKENSASINTFTSANFIIIKEIDIQGAKSLVLELENNLLIQ